MDYRARPASPAIPVVALAAVAAALACTGIDGPRVEPAQVTPSAFGELRWLEGQWRGTATGATAGEKPFFEGYRFVDDSTVVTHHYPDSTMATVTDTGVVMLRDGEVVHRGGDATWVATRVDSAAIEFGPREGASNSFTWARQSRDVWVATLRAGNATPTVYRMQRVGP